MCKEFFLETYRILVCYRCSKNMENTMYKVSGIIFSLFLVAYLVACDWFQGAPEARARDFIETLVVDPNNTGRLRMLSNTDSTQQPAGLVQGMAANNAIEYLRMKHKQGKNIQFTFGNVQRLESKRRLVPVIINMRDGKSADDAPVRFQVEFKLGQATEWRITRIWTGE